MSGTVETAKVIKAIQKYEGMTVEEAMEAATVRMNMPDTVFCGPYLTYPVYDERSLIDSQRKFELFGDKLSRVQRKTAEKLIESKGKHMGTSVEEAEQKDEEAKRKELIEWFLKKKEKERKNE